jgi:hypothetical protein
MWRRGSTKGWDTPLTPTKSNSYTDCWLISALTLRASEHDALVEAGATSVCLPITQAGRELAAAALTPPASDGGVSMTLSMDRS